MAVLLTLFLVLLCSIDHGIFDVGFVDVSVMEGDPVTLHTDALTRQHEDIKWYFNDRRIAEISGDLSEICTDVQCVDGDERFRDRLELDHQTGSLTVQDTRTTDSGLYELKLISSRIREKTFNVTVSGAPVIEPDEKSVKEGESLILDPGEMRNRSDVMMWYFNDILLAEITGDQRKICEEDRCKERFRDRLEVNYETGSLTILNIRDSDSGDYKVKIKSISLRRFNRPISVKGFTVAVTVPESGLSSAAVAGICAAVVLVLLLVAAVVIYYRKRQAGENDGSTQHRDQVDQEFL